MPKLSKKIFALLLLLLLTVNLVLAQRIGEIDMSFNPNDVGFGFGDGANNAVRATVVQPDGKHVIGGNFTRYDETYQNSIGRLNEDGSLDTSFKAGSGFNGSVFTLALQPDGRVLAGGVFTSYNGTPCNRIARLNPDGTLDEGFSLSSGTDGAVYAISLQTDGKIIVAGDFTTYHGTSRRMIARLFADGSLDTAFDPGSGFNSPVFSLAQQTDGKIVAGGNFSTFNGIVRNKIARLHTDGSLDEGFSEGSGFNGSVRTLFVQPDGKLLAGGQFTSYNGVTRNRIARLESDGSLSLDFAGGTAFNHDVWTMALLPDGRVLVGGSFANYSGAASSSVARLNTDGTLDSSFETGAGFDGAVYALVLQTNGSIMAAGGFSDFNGVTRNRYTRLMANGSLDYSFYPGSGFNYVVSAIKVQPDGKIIVGGWFTGYDGMSRNRIARLQTDGTLDNSFAVGAGFNAPVYALETQPDGKIIVGGAFSSYQDTPCPMIVRLNPDGSLDNSFNPSPGTVMNATVYTLSLQPDGKIIAGGDFRSYSGTVPTNIVRLHPDGSVDKAFTPGSTFQNGPIRSLLIQPDGKILAGGHFYYYYTSTARGSIARLNTDGSLDAGFAPGTGFNGGVRSMLLQGGGEIMVGGEFTSFNGISRGSIARLHANGVLDTGFDPGTGFNTPVLALVPQPGGTVLASGHFYSYGTTIRRGIALINAEGSLNEELDPELGFNSAVIALAPQPDGKVIAVGNFTAYNGRGRNRIARLYGYTTSPLQSTVSALPDLVRSFAFPNPTTGSITVSLDNRHTAQVIVTDVAGRIIMKDNISEPQELLELNLEPQKPGVYLLKIYQGNQLRTTKVLKL